ncbi:MAG: Second mannosyl transferase [Parcubacteria group bacterium GW2011_GWB1_43_6]|nr:MAG: Second mannosyl transferase [Parcubacteria group bacterium GW2011_GWB1_43_6]KKT95367.1 MAG: Second mannosyl transferase [Parcubacteria group bacterium GW2011_GWA2_45_15]
MKILYGITKSNFGGAQRYVFDLATETQKKGHDVAVMLGGTGKASAPSGLLESKLQEARVRTIFVKSFMRDVSIWRDKNSLFELIRIFRWEKPDIVHLNSSKAGGLGMVAARITGVRRIIFTSHGLAYDEDRNLLVKGIIWLATWATFLLAHGVIVISKDTFDRARQLPFCSKKIHLIYNGIREVNLKTRNEAVKELKITASPAVVALGELVRNKGYRYLIEAIDLLKQRNRAMMLYIMGDGDERQSLEKLITEKALEDQVHLLGYVPNGPLYLKAFDIFTLTSVKEGLPYVLLEAAQAELAVIGSEIPGITDIIENGVNGILVPPRDPETLLSSLILLHENPDLRKRLGANLKASIQENFSFEKMVENTFQLYS